LSAVRDASTALAEVPEAAADGSVAEVYRAIRGVFATDAVVLFYRTLAVHPGRLERIWAVLGPNLASAGASSAAGSLAPEPLGPVEEISRKILSGHGPDPGVAAATLDTFDRSNRLNLVALSALLHGAPGAVIADRVPATRPAVGGILPLVDLAALPAHTMELLARMSGPVAGPGPPVVIPSLYRAFAYDDVLLGALWQSIGPHVGSAGFSRAVESLVVQGARAAGRLPYRVERELDPETRELTQRFIRAIPGMIVVSPMLRAALRLPAAGAAACP
jgi:hypothetical protein